MATNFPSSDAAKDGLTDSLAGAWKKQYFQDNNFPEWTKHRPGITSALLLPERRSAARFGNERECLCMLCDRPFTLTKDLRDCLRHLLEEHGVVIGGVDTISDFPEYVAYWKLKLVDHPISQFCSVVRAEVKHLGVDEGQRDFYFLSDVLEEDFQLRKILWLRKLHHLLDVQERERNDADFRRSCLFCRTTFDTSRGLFDHMAFDHNFSVGQPDNLVHVGELMDVLEKKLDDLVCIFCENTFKKRDSLKEHMRKKRHKKIDPDNSAYDKYYIVNYLQFGRSSRKEPLDKDLPTGSDDDDEWSDDAEEEEGGTEMRATEWQHPSDAVCLFCPAIYTSVEDLFCHLGEAHGFDYEKFKCGLRLTFYQQIKLINFIRRRVYLNACIFCEEDLKSKEELLEHMTSLGHTKPPEDRREWDQSQYYFPTYENDNLLFALEDYVSDGCNRGDRQEVTVIAEDMLSLKIEDSVLNAEDVRNSICGGRSPVKN